MLLGYQYYRTYLWKLRSSTFQWTKVQTSCLFFCFALLCLTITIHLVISFHTKMYLFWNGRIEPVLSNVDNWNQTAMVGGVSQEDAWKSDDSIWYDADTKEEKHNLLKTTPLTQKCCGFFIIFHCFRITQNKKAATIKKATVYLTGPSCIIGHTHDTYASLNTLGIRKMK